jgi:hypothetical protein
MATEVAIAGSHRRAKIRHPVAPWALGVITLGIYLVVWWYMINRELKDLGEERKAPGLGDNPTLSMLAYLFGGLLLLFIPFVWTAVTTAQRIQRGQRLVNSEHVMNGWGLAALWIFTLGIGAIVYMQLSLNRIWETQPPPLPGAAAAGDLDRIKQLQELRESGAISEEEFEAQKALVLPSSDAGKQGSSTA